MTAIKPRLMWLVAVVAVTAAVYLPSLSNDFVNFDDPKILLENPAVTGADHREIWFSAQAADYVPLTLESFALEYKLAGPKPLVYHLTNLLLHLLTCVFVFLIFARYLKNNFAAAAGALVFGLHPLHVESVAWVTERKDVLSAALWCWSLLAYFKYRDSSKTKAAGFYVFSFLLFVAAALAKSGAVMLPVTLLLFDFLESRKISAAMVLEKIPYFGFSAALTLIELPVHNVGPDFHNGIFNNQTRLKSVLEATSFYLSHAVWPHDLSAIYEKGAAFVTTADYGVAAAVAVAIAAVFVAVKNSRRPLAFGVLFFLAVAAPVLQFIQWQGLFGWADRYFYVPSIGLIFIFAWLLARVEFGRTRAVKSVRIVTAAALVACAVVSVQRIHVWKDTVTLWDDVISKYPNSSFAHMNYGAYMLRQNNLDEAQKHFERAIEINPHYQDAHYDLGKIYFAKGQIDAALAQYLEAAEDLNFWEAFYSAGFAYIKKGLLNLAAEKFRQVLKINPASGDSLVNLGVIAYQEGHPDQAEAEYKRAIEVQPNLASAHRNLGNLYLQMGRKAEAEVELSRAAALENGGK